MSPIPIEKDGTRRTYILDTNVLLYDPTAFDHFDEHEIVIPITVIEELDRLGTHVNEVRRCLDSTEPVGRRLDFLMQELNREANTLSSKAQSTDTILSAVDLKVLIEQIREQVQNIE